jgi:hypothetical protein
MTSSVNGEYTYSRVEEDHSNTQDATQKAWPKWVSDSVEITTSTIDYQEGAWAVWWPAATTEERIIKDDLITKYDFQKYRSDRSASATKSVAPVEEVAPKKTTRKSTKKSSK